MTTGSLPHAAEPDNSEPELAATRAAAWPFVWMLCGALAFALMGACGYAASNSFDWRWVALARTSLALLFSLLLSWQGRVRLAFWRPLTLWWRSLAGSVSLLCTFYALGKLPVADVLTLTNVYPIWVAVLSWPLLGQWPKPGVWLAVACGVAGVSLIQQPHLGHGNFAMLAAIVASFTSALSMLGLNRIRGVDARAIVVHFSSVSTVACLGTLLVANEVLKRPGMPGTSTADTSAWLLLLGVGVAATVGQVFLTKAFSSGPPARVAVVGLSQVAFGMALDMVFWSRTFNVITLLGIVLLVAPTAWVMLRSPAIAVEEA